MNEIHRWLLLTLLLGMGLLLFGQTEYQVFRYPNDSISSEGTMRDGKPDGYWKTYYENGVLKSEGNRKDFLLDGVWYFFSEQGDTTLAVTYKEGLKEGDRKVYLSDEIQVEHFCHDLRCEEVRRYDRRYHLFTDGDLALLGNVHLGVFYRN